MPKPLKQPRVPSYRRHKPSGQAIVTLDGRDFYLGAWRSKRSKTEYDRLIGEWLAGGRQLPRADDAVGMTITELVVRYFRFAERYYRKGDRPTGEVDRIRQALRLLRQLYGRDPVSSFKPTALRAIRLRMIERGWCRSNINKQVDRIRRMFKWAVSHDLVPPDVFHGLQAVAGLRKGRCEVREADPVRPRSDRIWGCTYVERSDLRDAGRVGHVEVHQPAAAAFSRGAEVEYAAIEHQSARS